MTRVPILLYHSISVQAARRFLRFTLAPGAFAAHLAHLAAAGYTPLTAARFAAALRARADELPPRPVVITFDDGFADFQKYALPELCRHRFPATLYVVTGHVGGSSRWLRTMGEQDRPMLSWPQLREIASAGVEIGAHSHTHADLDVVGPENARDEIARSRDTLAQQLGHAPRTFAYPFGHYDRRVRALVEQEGYAGACAVRHAMSHSGDDPFAMARILVTRETGVEDLDALLQGHGLPLSGPGERLDVTLWRLIRLARGRLVAGAAKRPMV